MKKHILTLLDLEVTDFDLLIQRAIELKNRQKKGIPDRPLIGKTLGLLFDKPSTRTRVSLEAAMAQMGGTSFFIQTKDTQLSRDEPIKDVARMFSRYLDAVAIRTYSQKMIEEFAAYSTIPVINSLTDSFHPIQVLSDLMTIVEYKGNPSQLIIAWVGDGNNVCNSWINAASVMGLNLRIACPSEYPPDQAVLSNAVKNGCGKITVTSDPKEAVAGADIIYTDVWASMGQTGDLNKKKQIFKPFQVNAELLKEAHKDALVMHCLPAHRDEEITEDILEGPRSIVWDQAENKLHMHKAILQTLILS